MDAPPKFEWPGRSAGFPTHAVAGQSDSAPTTQNEEVPVKKWMLIALVWAVALPVAAKGKPITDADAAALQGKTVALTVHERPDFTAMTTGKVMGGIFGAFAMVKAGNALVEENHIEDPAVILRTELASAIAGAYGAQILPVDTTPMKASKPKDLAAAHPEADYVLDVRSFNWLYAYFPTRWGNYWVMEIADVQLVDTKTARLVGNYRCKADTKKLAKSPTREQLHADGAQLLKDAMASLAWTCVQQSVKEHFLPADKVAATPVALVDPFANIMQLNPAESEKAGKATAAAAPAAGAQPTEAKAPTTDAEAGQATEAAADAEATEASDAGSGSD
jgi:hypothetical protein